MIKPHFILLSTILPLTGCIEKNDQDEKPNILLILVDDMGFSDLGFMGSGVETPNIDRLFEEGIACNNFYNTGRCCPSRASLLTGLYPHQTGMGWMTASNLGEPGYTGDLNNHCVTLAQVLGNAGYSCYMTGKWHVTYDGYMKPEGPKHNWPVQRGFDECYGHLTGGGSYFSTPTLIRNNNWLGQTEEDFYLTTAVTDTTIHFLKRHFRNNSNKPFFQYLAYYAPHRPLHALAKDVDRYRGKYMMGWDSLRSQKLERLYALGIADSSWKLTERDPRVPEWDSLTEEEKKIWDARMAVYAAQIYRMDKGIGRVVNLLQEEGELDNTLIIFLSDNGASDEPQGSELTLEELPGLGNEFPKQSYREEWANVSNTPLRLYKKYNHEGGVATPLIIRWPERIEGNGRVVHQLGHIIDIMPTLLEIAGASYPEVFEGHEIYSLPGKSFVHAFNGETKERGPLFFEHEANRAVIDGDWKLVSLGTTEPPYTGDWELYNRTNDRSETNNLAEEYPEKVKELSALWDKWAKANFVYPLDGRGWNEKLDADVNK